LTLAGERVIIAAMKNEPIEFNLLKTEETRCLANLLSEFQAAGVRFTIETDANLIYVTVV
jgi:hypothetical protein